MLKPRNSSKFFIKTCNFYVFLINGNLQTYLGREKKIKVEEQRGNVAGVTVQNVGCEGFANLKRWQPGNLYQPGAVNWHQFCRNRVISNLSSASTDASATRCFTLSDTKQISSWVNNKQLHCWTNCQSNNKMTSIFGTFSKLESDCGNICRVKQIRAPTTVCHRHF